jgi:hypothetical protein
MLVLSVFGSHKLGVIVVPFLEIARRQPSFLEGLWRCIIHRVRVANSLRQYGIWVDSLYLKFISQYSLFREPSIDIRLMPLDLQHPVPPLREPSLLLQTYLLPWNHHEIVGVQESHSDVSQACDRCRRVNIPSNISLHFYSLDFHINVRHIYTNLHETAAPRSQSQHQHSTAEGATRSIIRPRSA